MNGIPTPPEPTFRLVDTITGRVTAETHGDPKGATEKGWILRRRRYYDGPGKLRVEMIEKGPES